MASSTRRRTSSSRTGGFRSPLCRPRSQRTGPASRRLRRPRSKQRPPLRACSAAEPRPNRMSGAMGQRPQRASGASARQRAKPFRSGGCLGARRTRRTAPLLPPPFRLQMEALPLDSAFYPPCQHLSSSRTAIATRLCWRWCRIPRDKFLNPSLRRRLPKHPPRS